MTNRRPKLLAFVAGIIAFTAALVLGVWLFTATDQAWVAVSWGLLWGVVVLITAVTFIGFLRETDPDEAVGEHRVVSAPSAPLPPATDRKNPWPSEWLAPALADAFDGTPYVVLTNGHTVLVHADLADARWQHLASLHGLRTAVVARLAPDRPGVLKRTDESRRVEWHATTARLGGQVAVHSGRRFGRTTRVEYGLGREGLTKAVDYDFSTSEINVPVAQILRRAGWRTALDSETKGALVLGALGASALVVVPIGLGISALVS